MLFKFSVFPGTLWYECHFMRYVNILKSLFLLDFALSKQFYFPFQKKLNCRAINICCEFKSQNF